MKKCSLTTLLFASGMTLLGLPAVATAADQGLNKFREMDTNNDGRLTDTEHSQYGARHFQECDRNNDGQVTLAELAAAGHGMSEQAAAAHLSRIDTDGNGVITRNESEKYATSSFRSADRNKDGILNPREFRAAHQTEHQALNN